MTSAALPTTMQAMHQTEYGAPLDVLKLSTRAVPRVAPDRLLIRVIAASTHAGDWHLIRGTPKFIRLLFGGFGGLHKPKIEIAGSDFAGIIVKVGEEVSGFEEGEGVFGTSAGCGFGAFAEFVSVCSGMVVRKGDRIEFGEAACLGSSGGAALLALRDCGRVRRGDRVLVNGASGGVGSFAVQIAREMGGVVTAVCRGGKVEGVRALGAERVVDYEKVDVCKEEGEGYDVIIDAAVFRSPYEYMGILKEGGRYVMVGGEDSRFFGMLVAGLWISMTTGKKAMFLSAEPTAKDLEELKEMVEAGKVVVMVDRRFELAEAAQAVAYLEERKVCGKLVIDVAKE